MFNGTMLAANAQPGQGGALIQLLPLILIFAIFYFLLIRPQQKRQKKHAEMLDALKAGDEVILAGGIYGKIDRVADQNTFIVEIADGVKVKSAKSGVASVASAGEK
ncbi:MAG: preprotein translocase subunit YajC [Geovibrio sp.]|uniref:preprotein translocase subunit YajC n=1 Tax=Geovibrio ferrireducens TaxID=46201 RepID=UPI0022469E2F|nr:preprotein translocase subunit YajC [Geovibrio ferrireducens]MCD8492543.1 preprotein translocase subunit YajC [Geovibrio sp.]MCD8567929.1 preprotein translocase subunit YajC [Geovibrio sp.]